MRLGGKAQHFTEVNDRNEMASAINWALDQNMPFRVIGSGSNIVWTDDGFPGLLIQNKIQGFGTQNLTEAEVYITAGGGMSWDDFVAKTTELGLTGLEMLSLIPGTVGATPVQNVGAYGQSVSDTLVTLEVYDSQARDFVTLRASDCQLGYRTSIFKTSQQGRYAITGATFFLRHGNPQPPYYSALQQYCEARNLTELTPKAAREAVIDIRASKLPDPAVIANCGSFFANPVIPESQLLDLQTSYPEMPYWPIEGTNTVKIPAAWLMEAAGFKDYHDQATGMATWHAQPLVVINESAISTAQLLQFRQKVMDSVQQKFGITLTQEPELLGS